MSGATVDVYLLRHGEVEGGSRYRGSTDDRLTALGVEQMRSAVAGMPLPRLVVTSPLVRCLEFAREFAQRGALTPRIDERWREIDFGAWEGLTADEIEKTAPGELQRFYQDPWNHGPPRGEPVGSMWARVLAAWGDVAALGEPALIVTHGGPIRVILCEAFGLAPTPLPRIQVAHGALNRVTLRRDDTSGAYRFNR